MTLIHAIEAAKMRERAVHAQEMAAQFKLDPLIITDDVLARHKAFAAWCVNKRVCSCPAQPAAVATYLREMGALGASTETMVSALTAIDAAHQFHGLSSPVATRVVDWVLNQTLKVVPPRSWNKDERAEWAKLPPLVREAITRTEEARDKWFCREQSKTAEARKAATNGAATTKSIQTNGKGTMNHDSQAQ